MTSYRRAWLRILLPFHVNSTPSSSSVRDLINAAFSGPSDVWNVAKGKTAHSEYFLEYLPHVQRFLFGSAGATGCRYLKVLADRLPIPAGMDFHAIVGPNLEEQPTVKATALDQGLPTPRGLQLIGSESTESPWKSPKPPLPDKHLPLKLTFDKETGIELWISQMGAGLLSLSIHCEPEPSTPSTGNDLDEFPHSLAKLNHAIATAQKGVWLYSEQNDPTVHLHQFLRELIAPLRSVTGSQVDFELRGLAFTALEIANANDSSDGRLPSIEMLSRLSQLHESSHPGNDHESRSRLLKINQQHYYCVNLNGAAHASVVSATPSEYETSRLRRIQMQYFPGFLLAQMQRVCLQQILNESTTVSAVTDSSSQELALQSLHDRVLRFGLEGEFVQVCWRSSLQKHHHVAQQECEIQEGLATVRHAMNDFNRIVTERAAAQQRAESERAAIHHREEVERSERTMHILEIFIVTVYSVEMAHALADAFHFGHTTLVGWSLVGVAVSTFFLTAGLLTWKWMHRQKMWATILALFIMSVFVHGCFGIVNWYWSPSVDRHSSIEGPDHGSPSGIPPVSATRPGRGDAPPAKPTIPRGTLQSHE